ncbi:PREDICTED: UPF0426 protein At1g28150, chloroplastic [Ipomoea nil]|uniref:UPF0426 protein At1g28150, chloroplastic n=1 Tax=Ipomoea nil TaxID=35883 RepID=UPI000901DEB6|nr:PREDICTED: UPF0426 protein At1g28150, chloroplastic [Ipomoea nil]
MSIVLGCVSSPLIVANPNRRWNWKSGKNSVGVKACFFNPIQEQPILKEALKEPIAFMGGVFAGLLRLDLNEDPLKEWVTKTVEASGITAEEIQATEIESEETPQQIEIE